MSDLPGDPAVPSGSIVVPPATTLPGAVSKAFLSLRHPGVRKGLGMILVFLLLAGLGYLAQQAIVDNADENTSDIRADMKAFTDDVTSQLKQMGARLTTIERGLPDLIGRLNQQNGAVEGLRIRVTALHASLARLNSDFDRSQYRDRQEKKIE